MVSLRRLSILPAAAAIALLGLAAAGAEGSALPRGSTPAVSTVSTGATGATGASVPLTATVTACHTDAVAANRYAIFTSVTNWLPGTVTMEVKFQLEERTSAGAQFEPVAVPPSSPGFDVWSRSKPPQPGTFTSNFTDNQEVTQLVAPASYRVLVHARWIDRHERVIHVAQALSTVCVQPLLSADLQIARVARVAGGTATTENYDVEVRNVGAAAAGPFAVSLEIGTTALTPVTVAGLAARATTVAQFSGPRCTAGDTLTAVADSANAVSEPPDAARTQSLTCPIA
jgi:hypothetical protein